MTVLVTGAGGAAGVAVIRALRGLGHRTVAADVDPRATGLRLADSSAVVPPATSPDFIEALCRVALDSGASLLVPTLTEEMATLGRDSAALAAVGLAHWFSPPWAIEICRDKWKFAEACRSAGMPVPPTALGLPDGVPGPWVVKPRYGRGSRDVYPVDDRDELAWPLRHVADPIWQTRLAGREFTVDALVGRDATLLGAVPRWRDEIKAGISTKGRTFDDDALVRLVGDLLAVLGVEGPANVQGFAGEDGSTTFVEVNPRFSGGLPLSLAAGADLVGQYLRGAAGEPICTERLRFRPGVTMSRFLDEVFAG